MLDGCQHRLPTAVEEREAFGPARRNVRERKACTGNLPLPVCRNGRPDLLEVKPGCVSFQS